MTYFNRGSDSRGGSSYGRRDSFDRGSDRPAMFDAVCAQCGANCQVPFRPNGRKEVFCSKCFETNAGGSSRESRDFGGSRGGRDGGFPKRDNTGTYFADKQMFNAICDGCGDNCKIPFEPRNGKPVFCSSCFAKNNGGDDRPRRSESSSYSRPSPVTSSNIDLDAINVKLDKIIRLLTPKESAKADAKEVAKEMTSKIVEEIEINSGKKIVKGKKKKVASKKEVKE